MAQWRVTRTVREYMDVEAKTRQEAKDLASDPYHVEVVRETARKVKPKADSLPPTRSNTIWWAPPGPKAKRRAK
jgi:hypothetical protein